MELASIAQMLPDSFEQFLPALRPWVEKLGVSPIAQFLQGIFAHIEVFHIIGLFMLGGASLVVNLRLIGVGLVEESASTLWRNTKAILNIGVVMVLVSGILIGLSNAEKLYTSVAFIVKMISLLAAIIFTYFVTGPVARADGAVSGQARIALVAALLIWVFSLLIFAAKVGLNPGVIHILTGGALITLFAVSGKLRWVFLALLLIDVAAWQVVTHFIVKDDGTSEGFDAYMKANKIFMWITAVLVVGFGLANIFGKGAARDSTTLTRLVGYSSILVWVTVAAAGRWIAFAS